MMCFTRVGILEDMIDLFGGIRFCYMDLFCVCGMRLLLDACAETLETLRLYPHDPHGEQLSLMGVRILTNDFTVESHPQDFDLSRNKSLRTFEITARYATFCTASSLNHALSTITSPVFSEVIVFYRDYDFWGVHDHQTGAPPTVDRLSQIHKGRGVELQRTRFPVFQEMHKARDFKLVLCADVWHYIGEYTVEELKCALATEKAEGGFDNFSSEPLVTCNLRRSRRSPGESFSHVVAIGKSVHPLAPL